ncbi:50S ribosomal protein L30 [Gammaproteobacteria bacterium]|jgi:large subunit ribosomal protein L30|nr:50S ribosomal protein L30 [Gammaproteobacteria bacterium]MDG2237375.1 50S ribosomal protein L30 [Arenicellales bacterium]
MSAKRIKVTLVKSKYGRGARQLACVHGLGLRRIHQTVELEDSPMIRGMVNKVSHLIRVEES